MREYSELHYPNLVGCRVKLMGSAAANGTVVSLPKEVLSAAKIAIPATPYDFVLGMLLFLLLLLLRERRVSSEKLVGLNEWCRKSAGCICMNRIDSISDWIQCFTLCSHSCVFDSFPQFAEKEVLKKKKATDTMDES
mmetsp:Transcript_2386/g.5514  ORF Transcript_2386/g.5514 Transcript_2386/m.5514 type:complete len:137 (-) Transcript_2386:310-720(-)